MQPPDQPQQSIAASTNTTSWQRDFMSRCHEVVLVQDSILCCWLIGTAARSTTALTTTSRLHQSRHRAIGLIYWYDLLQEQVSIVDATGFSESKVSHGAGGSPPPAAAVAESAQQWMPPLCATPPVLSRTTSMWLGGTLTLGMGTLHRSGGMMPRDYDTNSSGRDVYSSPSQMIMLLSAMALNGIFLPVCANTGQR